MKKIFILACVLCSAILLAFTTGNGNSKAAKVFDVRGEEIYLNGQYSHLITDGDGHTLARFIVGFTACQTQSVLNQCSTKLAVFSNIAVERMIVENIIRKYNDMVGDPTAPTGPTGPASPGPNTPAGPNGLGTRK